MEFKDAGFQMDWVPEDPPSGSDVLEVAQNVIMRKPLRVRSFGHLLRDNIRAIAELAGYFGVSVSSLQWIPHAPASNEESGPGLVRPRVLFVAVHQVSSTLKAYSCIFLSMTAVHWPLSHRNGGCRITA